MIALNESQQEMLDGGQGVARQMGMRLVLDLAAAAGATTLVPIESAHLSGVSPLTGGLGLRRFLAKLASDAQAQVAVPTTLNSAGCDENQFAEMRIVAPDFLAHNHEIVTLYTQLGVRPTQSCIPYEWDGVVLTGAAAWAESNAICFGNSYCDLITNRESGLSALAAALTGYTPGYGLLTEEAARRPNLAVMVTVPLDDPTDFSILGDWIGKQRKPSWSMPLGLIPVIKGLPSTLSHEQRKALTAAAANYGCPLLYIDGQGERPAAAFQDRLLFDEAALAGRYEALRPRNAVSLITLGCPQASVGELRAVARALQGRRVAAAPENNAGLPPLWVFTSSANLAIAEQMGVAGAIRDAGALLLADTCPEVVPYDRAWVHHVLTNSMKAEHYIQSGLNGIPTSVMTLADCVAVAAGEMSIIAEGEVGETAVRETGNLVDLNVPTRPSATGPFAAHGAGLPSQGDFAVSGEAFVTDEPITFLGFVNRETGVIEEPGHPAHGQSIAGKVAIFPKGIGSTVAPYVLLELYYRGMAPLAVVNSQIDQQSAPACSLEGLPYAYGFDADVIAGVNPGDQVLLRRTGNEVTLTVVRRVETGSG